MKQLLFLSLLALMGMSGSPNQFTCDPRVEIGQFAKLQCYIDELPYVPDDKAEGTWNHPVAFMIPPEDNPKIKLLLSGYSAAPTFCEGDDFSESNHIVVKSCAGHWPDLYAPNHDGAQGWLGRYKGPSNSYRFGLAMSKAMQLGGDVDHGVLVSGASYGGSGSILQSLLLREADEFWQDRIVFVRSDIGETLIVKNRYPVDPKLQQAWEDYDPSNADIIEHSEDLEHIYYRINGSPADTLVTFDLDIFHDFCDAKTIPCFGTWSKQGHNLTDNCSNLPFLADYALPDSTPVSLRNPLAIFTYSTGNYYGESGHYNLGLGWISDAAWDTANNLTLPIKYVAQTDISESIPDMPEQVTFTLTIRRIPNFNPKMGEQLHWKTDEDSGYVFVEKDGEIKIPNMTLRSQNKWVGVVIKKAAPPPEEGLKIVYSRQPYPDDPVPDPTQPLGDPANWSHVPDGGQPFRSTEYDLVMEDLSTGEKEVIHNCTESTDICAAGEARVSPDGENIAYSVMEGDSLVNVKAWGGPMTYLKEFLHSSRSSIYIYHVPSGEKRRLRTGFNDRMPDWLNNSELVFASDQAGTWSPWSDTWNYYQWPALHIFRGTVSENLNDAVDQTPHANFMLSPIVLSNAYVCATSFQGILQRGVGHTPNNQWWIECWRMDRTDLRVELAAHGSPTIQSRIFLNDWVDPARAGPGVTDIKLPRGLVELREDYIAVPTYYRNNSLGANGAILGYTRTYPHEGVSQLVNFPDANSPSTEPGHARYIPPDMINLTPYGNDQDTSPRYHLDGRAAGRAGYPARFPNYPFMFTHRTGWAYEAALPELANVEAMGGEDTARAEIRVALVDKVTNPFDDTQSKVIACPKEDRYNCWDAVAVAPYSDFFDQDMPDQVEASGDGECWLQVVNARNAELAPIPWSDDQDLISYQGNFLQNYSTYTGDKTHAELITAFRIDTFEQCTSEPTTGGFCNRQIHSVTPLEADGSVAVNVPCETPILMLGVDDIGNIVATDNMPHSLPGTGERRTCYGCHDGHSQERYEELGALPEELFAETIAGSTVKGYINHAAGWLTGE